jgi:hypothetical protein
MTPETIARHAQDYGALIANMLSQQGLFGTDGEKFSKALDFVTETMRNAVTAVAAEARASAIEECARAADGHRTAMENSGCHREAIGARVARDAIRALLAPRADGGAK